MLEHSALSDYEKQKLKRISSRVEAFKISGATPTPANADDIPF
ncbi:hypothetical protein BN2497_10885 [Janthinobacterium sp. CG23_2]|nr:hypothetical protein BN2497_10885 [Janthinobacterium sp. CG23_2]CUU31840.1 hypothetical protein BN3177_10885 [Janthinobacterium sp. CG23_2]